MKVVAFIEPPQAEVIEKILKHCGLWQEPASRAPLDINGLAGELPFSFSKRESGFSSILPGQELVYEDIDTFLATF